MDDFERELSEAMKRQPAPAELKRKVLERRRREHAQRRQMRVMWWRAVGGINCAGRRGRRSGVSGGRTVEVTGAKKQSSRFSRRCASPTARSNR